MRNAQNSLVPIYRSVFQSIVRLVDRSNGWSIVRFGRSVVQLVNQLKRTKFSKELYNLNLVEWNCTSYPKKTSFLGIFITNIRYPGGTSEYQTIQKVLCSRRDFRTLDMRAGRHARLACAAGICMACMQPGRHGCQIRMQKFDSPV